MQTIETSIFNVNGGSLPGPLIIGTFEKRAPGPGRLGPLVLLKPVSNRVIARKLRREQKKIFLEA